MPVPLTLIGLAVNERVRVTDASITVPPQSVFSRCAFFAPTGALLINPGGTPTVTCPSGLGFDAQCRLCTTATVAGTTTDPRRGGYAFDAAGRLLIDTVGNTVPGYQGAPITAAGALPVTLV